ncbi:serine-threonine protein kinase [Streptomyces olivoreticuli]|uniref:serine-threonine protein kinase n=1 Tax=Streptomyces olivoreticuli TaxID=68246 RepID=UPI0019682078|nr:serine-threonine protein kinase [Streptomyces olivoreticuli]
MPDMSVEPYWELTFDKDGDVDPAERDALVQGVARAGVTDLVVFAHGWNNERSTATRLYDRFFAPFPGLLTGAAGGKRLGYAGVIWPSMDFPDEPIPHFPSSVAAAAPPGAGLDPATRDALVRILPCEEAVVDRLSELLAQRPEDPARLEEFVSTARGLVADPPPGVPDLGPGPLPAILTADARTVCESFSAALASMGALPSDLLGSGLKRLWHGAYELLRQLSYYTMKRRAGVVGEHGLGPFLGLLAGSGTGVRTHLVGHSFGARLVSFALGGLPDGASPVFSVTLLQGAFSHYAFATSLPFASDRGGALSGLYDRVNGPLVCCYSSHDTALGVLYPLASLACGDDDSVLGLDDTRWGALGHDGMQSVDACAGLPIARAPAGGLPAYGCVNVDASAVVAHGGPPSGAHGDICHEELARVVLLAGGITR